MRMMMMMMMMRWRRIQKKLQLLSKFKIKLKSNKENYITLLQATTERLKTKLSKTRKQEAVERIIKSNNKLNG